MVVANGGGGIPVVRETTGRLRGVEAVIDKDLGAALLGVLVGADVLVIATDVPHAVLRFGTPEAEPIGRVERRADAGVRRARATSPAARWGPKVDAVCRFVQATGRPGVITNLDRIVDAVTDVGTTGTVVVPD